MAALCATGCDATKAVPMPTVDGGDSALCPLYTSGVDNTGPVGTQPGFVEGARASGIDFVGGVDPRTRTYNYLDWMGNGGCVFDYDGDGRPDIFFTSRPGAPACAGPSSQNRLFHNDGKRHFTDVSTVAGLSDGAWGTSCAVGDIDADGDLDLFVADSVHAHLYENRKGVFADITPGSGIVNTPGVWMTSSAFADLDSDGKLDLYVGQFNPAGGSYHDVLFRNLDGHRFREVSAEVGIITAPHPTLVTLFFDVNFDSYLDVYIGNDFGDSQLFVNQGDGTFLERAFVHGLSNSLYAGRAGSMMGLVAADLDGDGLAEILASDDAGYPMIINKCDSSLVCKRMSAEQTGLAATIPDFKWGIAGFDADDDGRIDLLTANGFPIDDDLVDDFNQGFMLNLAPFNERSRLFLGVGGDRLSEFIPQKGDGLRLTLSGRGAIYGDLDGDGDMDAIITSYGERPLVLYNQLSIPDQKSWATAPKGTLNRPLNVHLRGTRSSPDPIGASVTVKAGGQSWTQVHQGGGLFLSNVEPFVHFGLGRSAAHVESVSVHWPAGGDSVLSAIPDDATSITMTEP